MTLKQFKLFTFRKKSASLFFLTVLTPVLLLAFQNCESSGLGGFGLFANNTKQESGGGNGEPYDGKPLWSRLVPGLTCANQNIAVGSLELHANSATLISTENSCSGASTEIPLTDLEYSTFSEKFIGYQDGVYTRLASVSDSIHRGVFTETWCRVMNQERTKSVFEFAVEWEDLTRTSRLWVYDQKHPNPNAVTVRREINLDRVIYESSEGSLRVNFGQKTPGSFKVNGVYAAEIDGVEQQLNAECLMGGQFDPVAPKFEYSAPTNQTLIEGEPLDALIPKTNKQTARYTLEGVLPKGLAFDSTTGSITGRPTEVSARQTLLVTANYALGSVSQKVSIGVGRVIEVTDASSLQNGFKRANEFAPVPAILKLNTSRVDFAGANIVVTGDVSLVGGYTNRTVIDAHHLSNHFDVREKAFLELRHLHLTNGFATRGGSIEARDANVLVQDTVFETNAASGDGAGPAIYMKLGNLEIGHSEFLGNSLPLNGSGAGGGAVALDNTSALIRNSLFKANQGRNGGAIGISGGLLTLIHVNDSTFEDNLAFSGGAIYSMFNPISVSNCRFIRNQTYFDGGAIALQSLERSWISSSVFDGNNGAGFGSTAVYWQGNDWGGWHGKYAALYIVDSEFMNHTSRFKAGVILNMAGEIVLKGTKLHNNVNLYSCHRLNEGYPFHSLGGNASEDGSCPP